jgi:hypothetical protein
MRLGVVQEDREGVEFCGTHQLLVCADDIHLLNGNINTARKTEKLYWALVRRLSWN